MRFTGKNNTLFLFFFIFLRQSALTGKFFFFQIYLPSGNSFICISGIFEVCAGRRQILKDADCLRYSGNQKAPDFKSAEDRIVFFCVEKSGFFFSFPSYFLGDFSYNDNRYLRSISEAGKGRTVAVHGKSAEI